jgi:hypothetical protein
MQINTAASNVRSKSIDDIESEFLDVCLTPESLPYAFINAAASEPMFAAEVVSDPSAVEPASVLGFNCGVPKFAIIVYIFVN